MRKPACLALIALLIALVAPAPARAAESWTMTAGKISVVPGGGSEGMPFGVSVPGEGVRFAYDVVFDIAAAAGLVTLTSQLSTPCVTAGTTLTCPQNDGGFSAYVGVTAAAATPPGTTIQVPVRVVRQGRTLARATGRITVADAVAMTATQVQDDVSVPTGATAELTAALRNTGERPITGVVLRLQTAVGMRSPDFANCTPIQGRGAVMPTAGAACLFEGALAPGQEYRLAAPWPVTATDAVWAPTQWLSSLTWYTAQDWLDQGFALPGGGSGAALGLTPAPEAVTETVPQTEVDPDPGNNTDEWQLAVTGHNASTFTVRGDTVSGRVGRTVTVRTSVRNNGPARMESWGNNLAPFFTVTVRPPAGTKVVAHSPLCRPFHVDNPLPDLPWPDGADFNDGNYYCWTGRFEGLPYFPGETVNFDFKLRIDKPGTLRGTIRTRLVPGEAPPVDQEKAIVVNATAAPTTAPPSTAPPSSGGGGGGLPITGSNTTAVALIGLALLLVGAGAMVATRRCSN